jgi:hypothetical protein
MDFGLVVVEVVLEQLEQGQQMDMEVMVVLE